MKFKKLMLVTFLLLAILTIGAVSAAEDTNYTITADNTDELTLDESLNNIYKEGKLQESDSSQELFKEDEVIEEGYDFITPNFSISVPNKVYEGKKATITFTSSDKVNGSIYLIDLNNGETDNNHIEIKNGKGSANIKIPYVKSIYYQFESSDASVDDTSGFFKINVVKPVKPVIKANNFNENYPSKTNYKVRIVDSKGVSIGAGKKVTFTLYNNKKKVASKTSKTDKNGYAKVYFDVSPIYYKIYDGHYKIQIKCDSSSVTKKYTIKGININYKKFTQNKKLSKAYYGLISGFNKKISISFCLKKADGSYFKYKTVKFNFKGKTYSAKTNKKGVVTFSLKKSLLKKGYSNTFKIYYLKCVYKGNFGFHVKKLFRTENYNYKYYIDMGGGSLLPSIPNVRL